MKKKVLIGIIIGGLVLTCGIIFYTMSLVPQFSYEELQDRCKQHTSDQDCKADHVCQAYELTPVCINTSQGQNCLPGGYQCLPNNDYIKKSVKFCFQHTTETECQATTDCEWEPQPGGYKCVDMSQKR